MVVMASGLLVIGQNEVFFGQNFGFLLTDFAQIWQPQRRGIQVECGKKSKFGKNSHLGLPKGTFLASSLTAAFAWLAGSSNQGGKR
jgi:hypothetical protein